MTKLDPIFSRQEQAVVYFFSRYWDQIDVFRNKWLYDIKMRFPDASMKDQTTGDLEAIEFEYALSSFDHHFKAADRKTLKGYKALYLVYWDEDASKEDLRKEITSLKIAARIEFVCLSKYFSPVIERELHRLGAYWEFRQPKCFDELYSFKEIKDAARLLENEQLIRPLQVNRDLYRVAGFNKRRADFIECDHWKRIHLYTTMGIGDNSVPYRLFVKPTGSGRFEGCFEVRYAFKITEDSSELLTDFFRKYYFCPYSDYYMDPVCLVYSSFTSLNAEQGTSIYDFLSEEDYALKQASELIEDSRHKKRIDKIVAQTG